MLLHEHPIYTPVSGATGAMTPLPTVGGLGRAGMTRVKSVNIARSRKP